MTTLSILNHSGDLKLTWNHEDAAERERIRAEVEQLRAAGYTFFLVDGSPADEVTAGQGELVVKRLTADEVVEAPGDGPLPAVVAEEPVPMPKRRGRPPKAKSGAHTGTPVAEPNRNIVAVRPLRGG